MIPLQLLWFSWLELFSFYTPSLVPVLKIIRKARIVAKPNLASLTSWMCVSHVSRVKWVFPAHCRHKWTFPWAQSSNPFDCQNVQLDCILDVRGAIVHDWIQISLSCANEIFGQSNRTVHEHTLEHLSITTCKMLSEAVGLCGQKMLPA